MLKEATPSLTRVALLINPDTAVLHGTFYTQALEDAAASVGVESMLAEVYNPHDIETAVGSLAKQ
jgi:hypothetical protein